MHEDELDFIGMEKSLVKKEILAMALKDKTIPLLNRSKLEKLDINNLTDDDTNM